MKMKNYVLSYWLFREKSIYNLHLDGIAVLWGIYNTGDGKLPRAVRTHRRAFRVSTSLQPAIREWGHGNALQTNVCRMQGHTGPVGLKMQQQFICERSIVIFFI